MILNRLWTPSRVLRKYSTRPPSSHPAHPLPTSFSLPPPAPPHPYPLPLTPVTIPSRHINALIDALPKISSLGTTAKLQTLPKAILESELNEWRYACSLLHSTLTARGTQGGGKWQRKKVVRIVAHTMRLLMTLHHFKAAKELDRAFFTSELALPRSPTLRMELNERIARYGIGGGNGGGGKRRIEGLGDGINLSRGRIHLAWMQSLALRLQPGLYEDLSEFGEVLKSMHEGEAAGGRLIKGVTIAFLLRQVTGLADVVESRRGGETEVDRDGQAIGTMINAIRNSQFGGTKVVRQADASSIIRRLRRGTTSSSIEGSEFGRAQEIIRELVKELDEQEKSTVISDDERLDTVKGIEADITSTVTPDSSTTTVATRESLIDRAQTLQLTIEFLLLQSQLSSSISNVLERRMIASNSLKSATQIYSALFNLLPSVQEDAILLLQFRQRQSSTLYRLLWACLGTYNINSGSESLGHHHHHSSSDFAHNIPLPNLSAISHIHSLVTLSLAQLSSLPSTVHSTSSQTHLPSHIRADPRLLLISTRFFRRLLYTLSLPASPHSPPASRTPWHVLRKSMQLIKDCTEHDRVIGLPRYLEKTMTGARVVQKRSLIIHLVRATVLGAPGEGREEGEVARLKFLLKFLGSRGIGMGVEGDEVGMKQDVRNALVIVLRQEGIAEMKNNELVEIVDRWIEGDTDSVVSLRSISPVMFAQKLIT